jgi:hypothetical protein
MDPYCPLLRALIAHGSRTPGGCCKAASAPKSRLSLLGRGDLDPEPLVERARRLEDQRGHTAVHRHRELVEETVPAEYDRPGGSQSMRKATSASQSVRGASFPTSKSRKSWIPTYMNRTRLRSPPSPISASGAPERSKRNCRAMLGAAKTRSEPESTRAIARRVTCPRCASRTGTTRRTGGGLPSSALTSVAVSSA